MLGRLDDRIAKRSKHGRLILSTHVFVATCCGAAAGAGAEEGAGARANGSSGVGPGAGGELANSSAGRGSSCLGPGSGAVGLIDAGRRGAGAWAALKPRDGEVADCWWVDVDTALLGAPVSPKVRKLGTQCTLVTAATFFFFRASCC